MTARHWRQTYRLLVTQHTSKAVYRHCLGSSLPGASSAGLLEMLLATSCRLVGVSSQVTSMTRQGERCTSPVGVEATSASGLDTGTQGSTNCTPHHACTFGWLALGHDARRQICCAASRVCCCPRCVELTSKLGREMPRQRPVCFMFYIYHATDHALDANRAKESSWSRLDKSTN